MITVILILPKKHKQLQSSMGSTSVPNSTFLYKKKFKKLQPVKTSDSNKIKKINNHQANIIKHSFIKLVKCVYLKKQENKKPVALFIASGSTGRVASEHTQCF